MAATLRQRLGSPGRWFELAPGLALCGALAIAAFLLAQWPALNRVVPLSALTVGIVLGVLVRLVMPVSVACEPGIRWALRVLLRAGIVLLGLRLVLQDMLTVGAGGLALVVLAVASTLTLAVLLGRALGLPDTLSVLVGAGTGICGASAVVAVDGVIRGRQQDVACAIAMVTVFGTVAMFVYPAVAAACGFDEAVYAAWAGSSIHEVAQAVAAGFAYDAQAGVDASLFKLSRVALLAPACAALALWWRARSGNDDEHQRAAFPLFVVLFGLVVVINSAVTLPAALHDTLVHIDTGLLAVAMVAMGLQTRLVAVARLGWRPLALGLGLALWISLLTLGGALLIAG